MNDSRITTEDRNAIAETVSRRVISFIMLLVICSCGLCVVVPIVLSSLR